MALSREDIAILREAKRASRDEGFLVRYRDWVEQSRSYHEKLAEKREPSPDRLKEVFNF